MDDLFPQTESSRPDAFVEQPFSLADLAHVLRGIRGPDGDALLRPVHAS